jgi:hypothetical protein
MKNLKIYISLLVVIITAVFIAFNSCTSTAVLVDTEGKRITPEIEHTLCVDPRYTEDIVSLPAGTALSYDNLTVVTKHEGHYFSKRYVKFTELEMLKLLVGKLDVNDVKPEARFNRWLDYINDEQK